MYGFKYHKIFIHLLLPEERRKKLGISEPASILHTTTYSTLIPKGRKSFFVIEATPSEYCKKLFPVRVPSKQSCVPVLFPPDKRQIQGKDFSKSTHY